jgi:hypothetical protein
MFRCIGIIGVEVLKCLLVFLSGFLLGRMINKLRNP